jgi:hypothetical protein
MANLSNINNKFLFTDGDFLKIGNSAPINNVSSTESGISITNPNVASIALDNTGEGGKTFVIYSDDGGKLNFFDVDANSVRLQIEASGDSIFVGNVGIGVAPSDGNLHVRKTGVNTGITNVLMNANFADGSNGTGLSIGYRTDETTAVLAARTATGNIAFYSYDGGWSESMRIKNNGNVGIGITSPDAKLDVLQETRISYLQGNQYRTRITNTDGNTRILSDGQQSNIIFGTTGLVANGTASEKMRINWEGNVGIGTDSPGSYDNESDNLVVAEGVNGTNPTPGITIACLADQATTGRGALRFADGAVGNAAYRGEVSYDHATDTMRWRVAGSQDMTLYDGGRLHPEGGVFLGSSNNSNLLDDYDEGTWTPAVSGSGTAGTATYGLQGGSYTKIGNKVTCWFSIANFAQSGASGNFIISGLPFTCITTSSVRGCFSSNLRFYNMPFAGDVPVISLDQNSTAFAILWSRNNTTWVAQSVSNSGGQYIEGYVTYSTA